MLCPCGKNAIFQISFEQRRPGLSKPTFSICIPNYNYGHFIGDTIQSVLDQTYPHFEIIVADNASTDQSVAVVESFKDPRIRLIRNRANVGFAPNLQRATMFAQNDFINLLSSDDQMKPDALETYAQAIMTLGETDRASVVLYAQTENFDNNGYVHSVTLKTPQQFDLDQIALPPAPQANTQPEFYRGRAVLADSLSRLRNPMPFLSVVYARALWQAVEGYTGIRTVGPDKHFIYKLLALDPTVIYIPRPLFRYRDHRSPNRAAQVTTLKQPIDDYLYTLDYRDEDLKPLGLSKADLIHAFVDRVCLKEGLSQISRGSYAHAWRLFAFALASYPGKTLRLRKTYALLPLLLLGPLARLAAPPLRAAYQLSKLSHIARQRTQSL